MNNNKNLIPFSIEQNSPHQDMVKPLKWIYIIWIIEIFIRYGLKYKGPQIYNEKDYWATGLGELYTHKILVWIYVSTIQPQDTPSDLVEYSSTQNNARMIIIESMLWLKWIVKWVSLSREQTHRQLGHIFAV